MKLAVADTSPLNYLILIGEIGILPRLFEEVLVPVAVVQELRSPRTPELVRGWADSPPAWIQIFDATPGIDLRHLGAGEAAAIALIQTRSHGTLLIDERLGTREAKRRGIDTIGTLGILLQATMDSHLLLPEAFAKLQQTSFRYPEALVARLLEEDDARRRRSNDR